MEKINSTQRPMHLRALMLVGMCQAEMLPKGKASEIPRNILKERKEGHCLRQLKLFSNDPLFKHVFPRTKMATLAGAI